MSFRHGLFILAVLLFCALLIPASPSFAGDIFFREDFSTLDAWRPFKFPAVAKYSAYTVVPGEGKKVLKTESSASASAIVLKKTFDVYQYPRLRWRWKADNVYKNAASEDTKKGDDYAIRVSVLFKYDPEKAGFCEKLKYKSAKLLCGEYPPKCSLNYVWANREQTKKIFTSPFSEKSMMIVKSMPVDVGQWRTEESDILADYKKAFGEDPPATACISIMNNSDNIGGHSVSYVDFIEIFR